MSVKDDIESIVVQWKTPILIVSSFVGRGNYSIGEALKEYFPDPHQVIHRAVDDILLERAVKEDRERYKFISNHFRPLLYLIYRVPFFYYRKLFRERVFHSTDLSRAEALIKKQGIKTVICISHRPAFWFSILKERKKLTFKLYGVLTEFGANIGWNYICWNVMDGFISPIGLGKLSGRLPSHVRQLVINPLCRKRFYALAEKKGDKNSVLFVAGFWGQVSAAYAVSVVRALCDEVVTLTVHVVCGTNEQLLKNMREAFSSSKVFVYGEVEDLSLLMSQCASVITKPGFSTLVEAHAAQRKIFLLKGMPVAEDNNARFAVENFYAQWFSVKLFQEWRDALSPGYVE